MSKLTCFQNINVITMADDKVLAGQDVLVKDGVIVSIKPTSESKADTTIDGTDKFLMPGLFDAHVHMDHGFSPLFLMHGVTAVRDCGNDKTILDLRNDAESGRFLSPRIFISGEILEGEKPMWNDSSLSIKTDADAEHAIKHLQEIGANQVKLYHTLSADMYKKLITLANAAHLPVTGHVPEDLMPLDAVKAGITCIEHLTTLDYQLNFFDYEEIEVPGTEKFWKFTNPSIKQKELKEFCQALSDHGTYLCPTLVVHRQQGKLANYDQLVQEPSTKFINKTVVAEQWNPKHKNAYAHVANQPKEWFDNYRVIADNLAATLPTLAKHATIMAGSDTANPFVVPGFSLIQELELLAESGLSTYQVLQAATVNPAKYLSVSDELGQIKPGASASLIMLSANPLKDIKNVKQLDGVFINDQYHTRAQLAARAKPVG